MLMFHSLILFIESETGHEGIQFEGVTSVTKMVGWVIRSFWSSSKMLLQSKLQVWSRVPMTRTLYHLAFSLQIWPNSKLILFLIWKA